ncbi:YdeI/OmpD-associated family protein [Streptomyces sp. NPDC006990]|uniref:YdeI/OmpD-associated family protein n=1 Tax=Streptomyces sp. NPDC006990 TaxID=3154481 RepID=UPI003454120B
MARREPRRLARHRIQDAKKAETRARRIEKYVAMLAKGEKLPPQPRKPVLDLAVAPDGGCLADMPLLSRLNDRLRTRWPAHEHRWTSDVVDARRAGPQLTPG